MSLSWQFTNGSSIHGFEVVGGCSGVVVIASPVVVIVVFSFTAVVSRIKQNDKHVNNLIFKE